MLIKGGPLHYISSGLIWYCCLYVSMNWVNIGSGNGFSPVRHQVITWTNAGLLSTGPFETKYSEISTPNHTISFKKIHLKMKSAKLVVILSRGDELSIIWCMVMHWHQWFYYFITLFHLEFMCCSFQHMTYRLNCVAKVFHMILTLCLIHNHVFM